MFSYEESFELELLDRSRFFSPLRKNFQVRIDINFGEYDRVHEGLGKLSTRFDLVLRRSFVNSLKRDLLTAQGEDYTGNRKKVIDRITGHIEETVREAQNKFKFSPWKDQLSHLIALELVSQLDYFGEAVFSSHDNGVVAIPVILNYAPLALRQIYRVREGLQ